MHLRALLNPCLSVQPTTKSLVGQGTRYHRYILTHPTHLSTPSPSHTHEQTALLDPSTSATMCRPLPPELWDQILPYTDAFENYTTLRPVSKLLNRCIEGQFSLAFRSYYTRTHMVIYNLAKHRNSTTPSSTSATSRHAIASPCSQTHPTSPMMSARIANCCGCCSNSTRLNVPTGV